MGLGNATGWNDLVSGNITRAAWNALDTPLKNSSNEAGFLFITLLFTVEAMVYLRTKNWGITFAIGLLTFGTLLGLGIMTDYFSQMGLAIFITVSVFQLAGIMYYAFFK